MYHKKVCFWKRAVWLLDDIGQTQKWPCKKELVNRELPHKTTSWPLVVTVHTTVSTLCFYLFRIPLWYFSFLFLKISEPPLKKPRRLQSPQPMQVHQTSGDKTNVVDCHSELFEPEPDLDELLDGSIPKKDFVRLLIDSLQHLGYRYFESLSIFEIQSSFLSTNSLNNRDSKTTFQFCFEFYNLCR